MRVSIKFCGEAGYGIMAAGAALMKVLGQAGYFAFGYPEYPSLIRGGHNIYQITVDTEPIYAPEEKSDIIVCLDKKSLDIEKNCLKDKGLMVVDENYDLKLSDQEYLTLPLTKIVEAAREEIIHRNTVALGAIMGLLDLNFQHLETVFSIVFVNKPREVVEKNLELARLGQKSLPLKVVKFSLGQPKTKESKSVFTGNEALAEGFLAAGGNFCALYPMTPITNISHYLLSKKNPEVQIFQPTDEIEGINACVGAAFGGARVMAATSGGGIDLMAEGLSLAAATDIPVVVINGQRVGPSTGMPTWTEQGDLSYVLSIGHGDFPRFVFAPSDLEECYQTMIEVFNLSQKYRIPAIILVDKLLCESHQTIQNFPPKAGPPLAEKSKIQNNCFANANSYEHDEQFFPIEDGQWHLKNTQERGQRFIKAAQDIKNQASVYGENNPDILLISWGSTKGSLLDFLNSDLAKKSHKKLRLLNLRCLSPFPAEIVAQEISQAKKATVVEANFSGQLKKLIRQETGIKLEHFYKIDGRPFYNSDLLNLLN